MNFIIRRLFSHCVEKKGRNEKICAFKRLLQLIPILLVITFLSFGMMRLAGSDAVLQKMENTGMVVSQEVIDNARAELGLDQPFLTQYFVWLGNLLTGDMGTSYISGKEVLPPFFLNCLQRFYLPQYRFSSPL